MALDLFKKTDSHAGLFAVEKAALLYNLLTSVMILIMFHRLEQPWQMLIDRAIIAGGTFLLIYLYRFVPCKCSIFVRVGTQISLLAYWYPDTYDFNCVFPNLDHVFALAEHRIFGCQPAILFPRYCPQAWVSELLHMGYFCYYPMIATVVIFYFIRRYELYERLTFVLITSFFIYYFIYMFLPVAGPQFYFPAIGFDNAEPGIFPAIGDYFTSRPELIPGPGYHNGFFHQLVEGSQQAGERPTAAFPSSHVGLSTIMMIMAYRANKLLFAILMPFYVLLCGATVYIQAHYLIDSIAGFVSAFGIYALTDYIFCRYLSSARNIPT